MSLSRLIAVVATAFAVALTVALVLAPKAREADLQRAEPAVRPAELANATTSYTRAAFIDREDDGHYWTRADVGGTEVRFMVDTGASIVALTFRDAQRLGLEPEKLEYSSEIRTAGGITHGAPVTLESIRIGRVEVEQVDAVILKGGLEQSLLGMTFLGELQSYEFRKGQLIIRQ